MRLLFVVAFHNGVKRMNKNVIFSTDAYLFWGLEFNPRKNLGIVYAVNFWRERPLCLWFCQIPWARLKCFFRSVWFDFWSPLLTCATIVVYGKVLARLWWFRMWLLLSPRPLWSQGEQRICIVPILWFSRPVDVVSRSSVIVVSSDYLASALLQCLGLLNRKTSCY